MNNKMEGSLAIIAAMLVLFSAMIDPRISVIVALAGLVTFAVYKFVSTSR